MMNDIKRLWNAIMYDARTCPCDICGEEYYVKDGYWRGRRMWNDFTCPNCSVGLYWLRYPEGQKPTMDFSTFGAELAGYEDSLTYRTYINQD